MTTRSTTTGEPAAGLGYLLGLAALIVIGAGLHTASAIFAPTFLAISLVVTARPLGVWMIRRGVPSALAALTIILILVALLGLFLAMGYSVAALTTELPKYSGAFTDIGNQVVSTAHRLNIKLPNVDDVLNFFNPGRIASMLQAVVSSASNVGSQLFVLVMVIAFVSFDLMTLRWRSAQLAEHQPYLAGALADFANRSRQYWVVATTFGLIVAAVNYGTLLLLGIPLAFTWALLAFVTNYIPNVGFVIGVIPPAMLALLAAGWQKALWVVFLYWIANFIIQSLIQPKITGDAVGINPTTSFLSLMFWTLVVGPLGSILAVPLTLFAKAILIDANPHTRWMGVFLRSTDKPLRNKFQESDDPLIALAERDSEASTEAEKATDDEIRRAAARADHPVVEEAAEDLPTDDAPKGPLSGV